jgi:predicted HAD superfamily Cof-like phosphohydrolase
MFLRVKEFHRVFGQNIAESPGLPDRAERDLRIRLLQEETDEFCKAYIENDLIEMADGLADICYIIAGTCVSYGICPRPRRALYEGTGKHPDFAGVTFVNEPFESPYDDVLGHMTQFYNLALSQVVREDFARYQRAELDDDLTGIQNALMTMLTSMFGIGLHLGIPLNAVFAEVHRSNLAKAPGGIVRYRADGKVEKPTGWSPPDIKSILENRVNTVSS